MYLILTVNLQWKFNQQSIFKIKKAAKLLCMYNNYGVYLCATCIYSVRSIQFTAITSDCATTENTKICIYVIQSQIQIFC